MLRRFNLQQSLDGLGADRAVEYLRLLLVRYGALPPSDRRLADFQRWAAARLDGIGNSEHRQLLERFLRWRLLRHLRSSGTTAAPLGHGPYQRAKQRIIRDIEVPVISTAGAEACPPEADARLAAIRRLLLDQTLALGDRRGAARLRRADRRGIEGARGALLLRR